MKHGTSSIIGLEKHTNQVCGFPILLTSALFFQKLSIFWKITFTTSREKNYVLIINLSGMFEVS